MQSSLQFRKGEVLKCLWEEIIKEYELNWLKINFAYTFGIIFSALSKHYGIRYNGENTPVLCWIWQALSSAQTSDSK